MTIARRRRRYRAVWREWERKDRLVGRCHNGQHTPAEVRCIEWEADDAKRRALKRLDTPPADRAG